MWQSYKWYCGLVISHYVMDIDSNFDKLFSEFFKPLKPPGVYVYHLL
jgi:hypothetical protein